MRTRVLTLLFATTAGLGGCVAAAAGAGAAGAIYIIDRGAETTILAPPPVVDASAKRVFASMGITETKTSAAQVSGGVKLVVEGTMTDREISVNIETAGTGSKVVVIARKSRVTWDKDLAKQILEKIVEGAK